MAVVRSVACFHQRQYEVDEIRDLNRLANGMTGRRWEGSTTHDDHLHGPACASSRSFFFVGPPIAGQTLEWESFRVLCGCRHYCVGARRADVLVYGAFCSGEGEMDMI
jgi:hypothetical protein